MHGPLFREDFKLIVNDDKKENTLVGHSDMGADQKAWRNTKKLGSLLGVEEDVRVRRFVETESSQHVQTVAGYGLLPRESN